MKKKSLGVLSIIVACAAAVSITIASCDNNATDPVNPGTKGGGGKGPQVLSGSVQVAAVAVSGVGGSHVSFPEDNEDQGDIVVSNFNSGGVRSALGASVASWSQSVNGSWPADGSGGVNLSAETEDGEVSTLAVQQIDGDGISFRPTFSGGDESSYRVVLYGDDASAPITLTVPVTQTLIFYPYYNYWYPCCWFRRWGFGVHRYWGYCYWNIWWGPCCWWRFWWNGNWYHFNRASFLEGVQGQHYPYTGFSAIQASPLGGGVNNLSISGETAIVGGPQ